MGNPHFVDIKQHNVPSQPEPMVFFYRHESTPVLTVSTDNAFITRCACLSLILACMLEKPRDIPVKTWHLILEIVLLCSHETTGEFDASDAVGMPVCACIRHHFKAGNTSRYAG